MSESHPPCAICGHQADGADHVRVEVARVPPDRPPEIYHFHKRCFDRSQDWGQP